VAPADTERRDETRETHDATVEQRPRTTDRPRRAIDLDGTLLIEDMVELLQTGKRTIHRRLKAKNFPIPPLPRSLDNKLRWSGPVVRQWLERNGNPERRGGDARRIGEHESQRKTRATASPRKPAAEHFRETEATR
jgi:predicted DNA-binding transcriptional regulator AlpA